MKKIIISLMLMLLSPTLVYGSSGLEAKVGNNYYDTLEEAILASTSDDVITLLNNASFSDTFSINKTVNINLNGNDISAPNTVFSVNGGVLNLSGSGTIRELNPYNGAIKVVGSTDISDTEFSIVKVSKDVTLEGWSGININHDNKKSYGVVIKMDGKINAVNDTNGDTGIGIYVNGFINSIDNEPIIYIKDNAYIKSTGVGIYNAGYTTLNVGEAYISGVESGIAIKAGKLNIDGATIESTGSDSTPTSGSNNGVEASGTAIQIESNPSYKGDIELNISSGTMKSKDSFVIYEYIGKGNNSLVKSISISGGTFKSEVDKNTLVFSDSFKSKHSSFISGGKYSSNPNEYLKSGYTTVNDDGMYKVVKSTLKEVGSSSFTYSSGFNIFKFLILLGVIFIIYLNRNKIYYLIKRK